MYQIQGPHIHYSHLNATNDFVRKVITTCFYKKFNALQLLNSDDLMYHGNSDDPLPLRGFGSVFELIMG